MKYWTGAGIILLVFCIIGALIIVGYEDKTVDTTIFASFTVTEARLDSPALIVNVESPIMLVEKAMALNISSIYDTNRGYVILDINNDVGYLLPKESLWYGYDVTYALMAIAILGTSMIVAAIIVAPKLEI